jgi:hypothetical protein
MWDLWWTKWHLDRFFPEYFGFPVNFIPRVLHYKENEKTNHLHHRVAQQALRLRCVRSICCGALKIKRKEKKALVQTLVFMR